MTKPSSTRIYIAEDDQRYDFLWADTGDDGSIYFGLLGSGIQTIEQITAVSDFDADGTIFHAFNGPHKVSFHASGQCVLSNEMERGADQIRVRSQGIPLAQIETPTRMLAVISLVGSLIPTAKILPDVYVDLAADFSEATHVCCTIHCLPEGLLSTFGEDCASIIHGSTWQPTHALVSAGNAWHFTLHDAVHTSTKSKKSYVSVHGSGTRGCV